MPIYPLLPRLSANAAIAPVVAGQWEDAVGAHGIGRFLKGLAEGLDVAQNDRAIDSIDSIPDIWARPMLFRMALFASRGFDVSLHKKVRGEWRAILAMLALQDMRHLRLQVEAVHLADANLNGALGQTLLTLAPKDSADGNSSWNDIYVISYMGAPLAITTPTTLVASSADYSNVLRGQITEPWSTDGINLTDPVPHLTPEELSGLYLWLKELKSGLTKMIPADVQVENETCSLLLNVLDDYMQDVHNHAGGVFVATGNLVAAGLQMHIGIFELLDKMVQAPAPTAIDGGNVTSAVRLVTGDSRSKANPLLILSPNMLMDLARSRGLSLSQLIVWPGITAANVKEESLGNDRTMIDGVPLGNAQWRRPEEFFTERLAIHAGGNALKGIIKVPGSDILSKEDMSVILPLKAELLEYFTPQEIAHKLRIEKVGNDIKVQFSFPLSGINGKGIDYQVEKSYPMQEVIYLINNVPVIEIWPNFKRPGWQRYYLYYENSEAQNRTQDVGRDFFYVYPWAYGNSDIAGDTPERGLSNLYTARLFGFPEALICTVNLTAPGGINAQPVDVGFVLVDEPEYLPMQMGKSWKIGIDFGTSSTMLYYRSGTGEPLPLVLQSNLFQVTDSGFMRNLTYQNFIPSSTDDQQTGSFLSIFQLLNGQLLNGQQPQIRPLQDGNVFWLLAGGDGYFRENSSQIDTNLKWSSDMVGRLKVAAYVKQICLQSLAEAAKHGVGNISWNFSFPTAFSAQQAMTFQSTCQDAVEESLQDSGFVAEHIAVKAPEYWPESKASAYYFSRLSGDNLSGGAICMDIGAGTTDISVISGHPARIVYHTSLQFAGRYLFQSIYDHYNIFAPNLDSFLTGASKEQRNALIDADMRKHSDEYLHSLINMTGRTDVQEVLQLAQFALAGVFYYLGDLVGLLHEKGIYESDEVPAIYVGGNGSRILPWICGGNFTQSNPYITVFQDMLTEQSCLETGFGFRLALSRTPKVEVACGMVEDKPHNDAEFYDELHQARSLFGEKQGKDLLIANSMFAGDEYILQGETHSKKDFISAYDVADGIRIKKVDELRSFTEKFNENQHIWGEKISISDRQFADAGRFIQGVYAQETGNKPQKIFVEPVFILGLKGLLK